MYTETWYLRGLHEGLQCAEYQVELIEEGRWTKNSDGRRKRGKNNTK